MKKLATLYLHNTGGEEMYNKAISLEIEDEEARSLFRFAVDEVKCVVEVETETGRATPIEFEYNGKRFRERA